MELLPKIEVDLLQEEPEELIEEFDEEEAEDNKSEPIDIVPKVDKPEKNIIPEEDIFAEKKAQKKEEKPVKKKREISEAQKERLRIGREKALANRRAKAKEKQEIKQLKEKKTKKELEQLRQEVEGVPPTEPTPPPMPKAERKSIISLEDLPADLLVELQQKAIEGYDTKRKARKEQKKKVQQESARSHYLSGMIHNAVNPTRPPQYGEAGYFNDCF